MCLYNLLQIVLDNPNKINLYKIRCSYIPVQTIHLPNQCSIITAGSYSCELCKYSIVKPVFPCVFRCGSVQNDKLTR